jgi:hypothetical protein
MTVNPLKIDTYELLTGDALVTLKTLPANSVQTICTSPPYFALRSYNTEPVIFGGNQECEHIWGQEIPGSARGGSGPNSKSTRAGCDAWRGELGLEPTPGCKNPGSKKVVFKLRPDLSEEDRQYVIAELMSRGLL